MSLFRDYRIMRKILDTRNHGYAGMLQVSACDASPILSFKALTCSKLSFGQQCVLHGRMDSP